jgi:hypothetical protein
MRPLFLFEFLARFERDDKLEIAVPGEQRVPWSLLSTLEKCLSEPLSFDYKSLLKAARERLRESSN